MASITHKFRTLEQPTANESEEKALYSLFHQTVQFQTESVQNWQCEKSAKQHSIIIYRQYTNVHRVKMQPWLSTEIRKQCVLHWILCEGMFANSLELQTGTLVLLYNLPALARRQRRDQRVGTRFSRLWSAGTP